MNLSPPILYAEDDDNDIFLMQRAFRQNAIENPLLIVEDGQLAVDYLSGNLPYVDRQKYPLPCLLLLDLNLPRKTGLEVLQWIRSTPALCTLPVIVFSSSSQETDIQRATFLGANSYLIKPGRPDQLAQMVGSIREFWLKHHRYLPRNSVG